MFVLTGLISYPTLWIWTTRAAFCAAARPSPWWSWVRSPISSSSVLPSFGAGRCSGSSACFQTSFLASLWRSVSTLCWIPSGFWLWMQRWRGEWMEVDAVLKTGVVVVVVVVVEYCRVIWFYIHNNEIAWLSNMADIFGEIHEVRKGLWAFFFLSWLCSLDVDWLSRQTDRQTDSKGGNALKSTWISLWMHFQE